MHLFDFFQWLENTSWSTFLREDELAFPIIETVHILGLGVSVGLIMWVDLRLLGCVMRHKPVSAVIRALERWAIFGFGIMFISGALLFFSEPIKCYTTIAFRIKAVLLVLAGLNVWYFHSRVYRDVATWDHAAVMPWRVKMVGFLSLMLWFSIIIAGRWTAYF
jgi:hypothetical protein